MVPKLSLISLAIHKPKTPLDKLIAASRYGWLNENETHCPPAWFNMSNIKYAYCDEECRHIRSDTFRTHE